MAEASSDWADRLVSDQALSSDEEDFVSSQSTASADRESRTQERLSSALGRLHFDTPQLDNPSCDHSATRTFTPDAGAPVLDSSMAKPERKKLELLDLPLDVLKDIVKEVTHTNDLTSLALTCSALHNLTIPHMYSRFDIVWPESLNPSTEEYSGVDALSYGLSTLVMGEDVFHQMPMPRYGQSAHSCAHCGCGDHAHRPAGDEAQAVIPGFHSRRGNYYAQYTRTFSIGNGPLSWVQEYSVNREVGKMLGTLVALAVARMVNLEAFMWDMPTGVVREIWLALASLANRPGHECRLERVWVRWHDNSEHSMRPSTALLTSLLTTMKNTHIEHPSLSVLPPLKSVTVLDIDESAYVDELATLIERSRNRLAELRIGISLKASMLLWVRCAKETDSSFTPTKPWPKVGGVLSILSKRDESEHEDASTSSSAEESVPSEPSTCPSTTEKPKEGESEVPQETNPSQGEEQQSSVPTTESGPLSSACVPKSTSKTRVPYYGSQLNTDKLNLEVLELERVPLHVPTLLPTIEWTRLTTLTLMACTEHENLWRALRRKYAPPPVPANKQKCDRRSSHEVTEYSLNLKHLRTDNVSAYLMLFIKEAIAPNTLESVYLHEAPGYDSTVPIDAIYKHILRRHRLSLRKVLIDASERLGTGSDIMTNRWHKWVLNQDMISFVTSGRMPQLRELGMAMDHRNWHHFLQRLPNMSRLYALYLTHIGNAVHQNLKELALQVLDIVSIRPDLKITYIGLQARCYQILEGGRDGSEPYFDEAHGIDHPSDLDDDVEDDSMSPTGDEHDSSMPDDSDRLSSDLSDGYDTEQEDDGVSRVRFRLQEILFYDDKISVFKARHGVI
ncbi:uncharacterized protein N7496_005970 [Penicillium cataractarum]|uniref:F-box domain-containing protein n=1 Tax=Penicillium cataractarum TaxID=2100454 RepID=A0A9W9V5P7_9EURO|nr:uncharacterized protein N7496_005970 [Penicillium cataractarum]KAJ5369878.1 hypothetical protein N7496_005970 [Penicillium cataractarum]